MIANFLRVSDAELEEYKKDSQLLEARIYSDKIGEDSDFVEIDKAWDGIIYLLTGKNFEWATGEFLHVIFSGQLIDKDQNLGYGLAHYLISNEVKALNQKLAKI